MQLHGGFHTLSPVTDRTGGTEGQYVQGFSVANETPAICGAFYSTRPEHKFFSNAHGILPTLNILLAIKQVSISVKGFKYVLCKNGIKLEINT